MLIFVMRLRRINIKKGKNIGDNIYNSFYEVYTFGIFLGIFRYVFIRKMVKSIGYIF